MSSGLILTIEKTIDMKPFALIFSAFLATASLMAQQQTNDTLIIEKPNQVTIAQHDDTLSIKVQGKENQPNYLFEREVVLDPKAEVRTKQTHTISSPLTWDFAHIEGRDSIRRATLHFSLMADLNYGLVLPMGSPADMKFYHWGFWEVEFNFASLSLIPSYTKWWYELKYGLGWQMMYMKKNTMAYTNRDGDLLFGHYPEGADPKQSLVRSSFMPFTLMAHRSLNKGRSLGLGITMRYYTNLGSNTRTEYKDTDGKKSVVLNEYYGMRSIQWSAIAQYNFEQDCYFFVRYSPWSQFHPGSGPDYSSFTVGLGLCL